LIQNGFEAFEIAVRGTVDGLGDGGPGGTQGNLHFLSVPQTADGLQHPLPPIPHPQKSVGIQLPVCRFWGSVKIRG
jgi:hypothetical protein